MFSFQKREVKELKNIYIKYFTQIFTFCYVEKYILKFYGIYTFFHIF